MFVHRAVDQCLFGMPTLSKLKDLPLWIRQLLKIPFNAFQTATSVKSTLRGFTLVGIPIIHNFMIDYFD